MIEIIGKYNTAKCYCSELEPVAYEQIKSVCDAQCFSESRLAIMPDVHAGMGCTIGTTMTIRDKVVPGMVGVDIGCGMETVRLKEREIDFYRLDALIRREIPSGRAVRATPHPLSGQIELGSLKCAKSSNLSRAARSIGTLGGGNHFIEVDRGSEGELYLVVHSGSRHLGVETAKHYQDLGLKTLYGNSRAQIAARIDELKAEGREQEIEEQLALLKKKNSELIGVPKDLAYVEGENFDDYIHDMKLVQRFAEINRKAMVSIILEGMGLTEIDRFTTIHNYIDTDSMILRKGAVSAKQGQRLLIPINMRDGSLVCVGRGNDEWNCSAPHGAGRLMSRKSAMSKLSLDEYRAQMQGIFTTCVSRRTLDEAPMAYKGMDDIIREISPTADIVDIIKPVYNFKAGE